MCEVQYPLLQALANREDLVRNGKLTVNTHRNEVVAYGRSDGMNYDGLLRQTIVFIRDFNKQGQEISGYIDFGQRLKDDKFVQYFELKKRVRLIVPETPAEGVGFFFIDVCDCAIAASHCCYYTSFCLALLI